MLGAIRMVMLLWHYCVMLNIEADALAKQKLDPPWIGLQMYQIPGKGWSFSIQKSQITKQMLEVICTHINRLQAIKHWKTKFQLPNQLWTTIDWNILEQAYKESKEPIQCWVVKYMSGFLVMGRIWRDDSTDWCPIAHAVEKWRTRHILHNVSKILQQKFGIWPLKKLKQWFQVSNTWHKVADAILWCLSQWHGTALASDCPILHSVLDQELLGWDWLLDGWVVQSWTEFQEQCWALVWSHCSGKHWVAELIKKLWNVSWDMWAHQNRILHDSPWAKAEILENMVNNTIVDLYALGTQALPRDAMKLMHKPQEHMLWLPLKVKQQWIESVQVAWQQKTQHDYGQYLSEQWFMAKWVIYL